MIAQSTGQRLLYRIAELGIRIECRGDQLRLTPAAAISPELLGQLRRHKQVLMAILRIQIERPEGAGRCVVCHRGFWIDEPPRDGCIRTRCGRCGKFIGFRGAGGK